MTQPLLTLLLPYPPSVNRYWRRAGAHMHISKEGRQYRARVQQLLVGRLPAPLAGELELDVEVHPPDMRRRDLDNVLKALLDSLQHAGVYADDYQIARLIVSRRRPIPGGRTDVEIYSPTR